MVELSLDARLETLARHAYERGRARIGLERALVVTPVAALALGQCTSTSAVPVAAAVAGLAALVGLAAWRGRDYQRGASLGLVAGLSPFALPLLSTATGLLCSATLCAGLPIACVAGGVLGGLVLGTSGRGARDSRSRFWLSAVAVTVTAGSVGCLSAGLLGLAGLLVGLAAGTAPVFVLRRVLAPSAGG